MKKLAIYVGVVKQEENGKFLIQFPDFEKMSIFAENEKSILSVATGLLNTKLKELKDQNLDIPKPLEIREIQKELKEGEFTILVEATSLQEKLIDIENFKKFINHPKIRNGINTVCAGIDRVKSSSTYNKVVTKNQYFISLFGGVLFAIATFLPVVSFGNRFKVGFFTISNFKIFIGISVIQTVIIVGCILCISGLITACFAALRKTVLLISGAIFSLVAYIVSIIFIFTQLWDIASYSREFIHMSYSYYVMFIALVLIFLPLLPEFKRIFMNFKLQKQQRKTVAETEKCEVENEDIEEKEVVEESSEKEVDDK